MTIKRKIFTGAAALFLVLVVLAAMNTAMHKQVLDNLEIHDQMQQELARMEKYALWKNELNLLVSEIVASSRVPKFSKEKLDPPPGSTGESTSRLVSKAKSLIALVNKKQTEIHGLETEFEVLRVEIRDLHRDLASKIATMLALVQMDQVLGQNLEEAKQKSSLAPYVLKSLNQLSVVALNSLLTRTYTQRAEEIVDFNRRFLNSQLHIIDPDGDIRARFDILLLQIEKLQALIPKADAAVERLDAGIRSAHSDFIQVLDESQIDDLLLKARSRVQNSGEQLQKTSRRAMLTALLFLVGIPALTILGGLYGLHRSVIKPVTGLVETMGHFERGNLEARAAFRSPNEIGKIGQAFNVMADQIKVKIQELASLNQALQESEGKYRLLAENTEDVIFTMDSGLNYTYVSPSIEILCGYRPEEILGRNLRQTLPAESWAAASDILGKELQKKISPDHKRSPAKILELPMVRKDGTKIWTEIKASLLCDENGRPTGILGVTRDVSSRKKGEHQLLEAKKQAEEANKAKSVFLANMSHEIRTPLNGILGMLQLLQTTQLEEEQKEYILAAVTSTNRLTRLLSDILDLSRIEAGKLSLQKSEFNLKSLQDSVLETFSQTAGDKGLALEFTLDPKLPDTVLGDETKVQQILFNLVGNALKFTQKGRIQIEISLLRFADQHTVRVLFIVSDTGIGIPDERIHDIFEAFTQVENAYTRYYQGAGLGLSITRNLVRLMDGSLAIADTDGGGTTVFVSLPMRICRAEKKTTSENKGREAKAIGRLRILLAEDDRLSAMAAEKMLEKAGAVVTTVGNGKQALEKLKDIEFDLVLMDVQMPVMDGVEATQRIREGRAGLQAEETPIIAMTSYAMPGDREKFLASGMDGYVAKPFVLKNLESEIADVLNQKEKAGTAD